MDHTDNPTFAAGGSVAGMPSRGTLESVPSFAGSSIGFDHDARKRYKYHDRGDGVYDAARSLGQQPHLVRTGEHAGRSNVKFVGMYDSHLWIRDTFTSVVNVWYPYLFLMMLGLYVTTYLFFGILWYILHKTTTTCVSFPADEEGGFLTAYMFSLETQATIGFGSRVVGVCGASAVVLTIQNVTGMILDAIWLGVIFAKLSHPKHRGRSVLISESATIARRDGQLKFMFRIADARGNTALDARVSAFLYTWGAGRNSLEGEHIPVRVEPMYLAPIQSMLIIPTVLEHHIDERSPLFNLSYDSLVAMQAEIVVTFEAVSDFGDSFMVRQSYLASEIYWGHIFTPITHKAPPGDTHHVVDLSKFHDVIPQPDLPQLHAGPLSRHVLGSGKPGQNNALPYPALGENTLVISDGCALSTRERQKVLTFRVGDTRPGQMIETHVRGYLYEWQDRVTKEGEKIPYTVKEVSFGYETGADRLILRFPQLVTHTITADSPLSPWANPSRQASSPHAAELVVIVEGVMFYNSSNVMRTVTYKLDKDLKHGHSFVPMVSRGDQPGAVPVVNWQAFHAMVPTGTEWVPGTLRRGEAASAKQENTGDGVLGIASVSGTTGEPGSTFSTPTRPSRPGGVSSGTSLPKIGEVEMSLK